MGYIRIQDTMPEGPKFDGVPSTAGWLHTCALAFCARQAATNVADGFVPAGRVYKLTNDPPAAVQKAIQWLVKPRPGCLNPLWHAVDGGWSIHDYDDPEYGNPTRAGAEAR